MSVDALPILAFKVSDAQFDIASAQSFISLRDQAVRVRTLLSAMRDALLFESPSTRKVLIVGAGYAGVNAALWLTDHLINVTLVDTASAPFSAQRSCSTRYLSLTQYDWPATHHGVHDYPDGLHPKYVGYDWLATSFPGMRALHPSRSGGKAMFVPTRPAPTFPRPHTDHLETIGTKTAPAHVVDWETQFNAYHASHPSLRWQASTRVKSLTGAIGGVVAELELLTTGTTRREWFDYVLLATGFGTDGADVPQRGGGTKPTPSFWMNDTLATVGTPAPPRILISGDGDGALQDLIRAVVDPTLTTANEVLDGILNRVRAQHPGSVDAIDASWRLVTDAVTSAETQASQVATWFRQPGPHVWNELQRAHRDAAAAFATLWAPALVDAIATVVDRSQGPYELTLVYAGQSPGKVYALNRFLSVLLLEYFDYVSAARADFFGTAPPPVTPAGGPLPRVQLLADHKLNLQHSVFDPRTSEYTAAVDPTAGASLSIVVDELLVRHGTRRAPPLTVRIGLHEVGLELARIKLPYVAKS